MFIHINDEMSLVTVDTSMNEMSLVTMDTSMTNSQ